MEKLNRNSTFTECYHCLKHLTRAEANVWLSANVEHMVGEEWNKFRGGRQVELEHIKHARCVMKMLTGEESTHDHSKDEWFYMVAVGRFTLLYVDLLGEAFKTVVQDHYKVEAHHPEHENFPENPDCSDADILDMSVDRLSRNLQFNNSEYNWEQFNKFDPVFPRDGRRKLELYHKYTKEHAEITKKVYLEMKSKADE